MATPTYELIDSQILSSAASSVTFSSIPSTYRDLIVVGSDITCGGTYYLQYRINGDTGSNYGRIYMYGNGTSAVAGRDAGLSVATLNQSGVSATNPTSFKLQIFDYAQTDKTKTIIGRSNSPSDETLAITTRWDSTSAISSLEFFDQGASNLQAGSTFYLYGVAA